MKRIIYIVLFLFSALGLAQQVKPVEQKKYYIHNTNDQIRYGNYYFKDVNGVLDKFIGTWKYEQNNESFEVTFIKQLNRRSGSNRTFDRIAAHYKYIKNGIVVFDTNTEDFEENGYWIAGNSFNNQNNSNKVEVHYSEPNMAITAGNQQLAYIDVTYSPITEFNQSPTLTFNRKPLRFPVQIDGQWTQNPYQVPANLVLTKQ